MATKKGFKKNPAEIFISSAEEEQQTTAPAADPAGIESKQPADAFSVPKGYKLVKVTKSERLQLLVSKQMKADLMAAAKAHKMSMNSFINQLFEDYFGRTGE